MGKRVADAIHGTIDLTDLEVELLNAHSFQRIRGVKQLGLAHLVFPGADYSRMSHCVGVCHVTGMLLDSIQRNGTEIEQDEVQLYRAAGLLHDIGHYPFSHAAERAVKNHFASTSLIQQKATPQAEPALGPVPTSPVPQAAEPPVEPPPTALPAELDGSLSHEHVGKIVIATDPTIVAALKKHGINPEDVVGVIRHENPDLVLTNAVSSDLDADRIDYLLRTSHHTGLPYGHVDLPYLASQVTLDSEGHICLDPRATRTGEHLLLARYFDYQQVSFHKTVTGLELTLEDVLAGLIGNGLFPLTADEVIEMIGSGEWFRLDDGRVWEAMRAVEPPKNADDVFGIKVASLLDRRPPKLLGSLEMFGSREDPQTFKHLVRVVKSAKDQVAKDFGINPELFSVWSKPQKFTAIGSRMPASAMIDHDDEDVAKLGQSVRVLRPDGSSLPLQNCPESLLSVLADTTLNAVRVYLLMQDGMPHRAELEAALAGHIGDDRWAVSTRTA